MIKIDIERSFFVRVALFTALGIQFVGAATPNPPPAPPSAKQPAAGAAATSGAPPPLRFQTKARRMSTYQATVRFDVTASDVTFEAPEAYRDGFEFWASRMKGQTRSEVYEMMTMTQEADDKGLVTFRRTLPKFDVEIHRQGQIMSSPPSLEKTVATIVYEGKLDPFGNVKEIKKVSGSDDPEIDTLAIPEIFRVFPEIDGPHDLKIGDAVKEERVVRMPTKLNIAGLEEMTVKVTREYILKTVANGIATFDVKTTYADDPAFKSKAEKTTCHITGGGTGEATFEVTRGVFEKSRLPTTMRIEIQAPLRPLPNHPETEQAQMGRSQIDLNLLVSGQQLVRRVWGEDKD